VRVRNLGRPRGPRDDDRIRCRFCRLNPLGPRQDPLKYLHTEIRYKSTCNCLNYELQVYTTVVALSWCFALELSRVAFAIPILFQMLPN